MSEVKLTEELLASAAHWERLADEADAMDAHERKLGIFVGAGASPKNNQAATYRRLARCQRLEATTGLPHCQCHESPSCPLGLIAAANRQPSLTSEQRRFRAILRMMLACDRAGVDLAEVQAELQVAAPDEDASTDVERARNLLRFLTERERSELQQSLQSDEAFTGLEGVDSAALRLIVRQRGKVTR